MCTSFKRRGRTRSRTPEHHHGSFDARVGDPASGWSVGADSRVGEPIMIGPFIQHGRDQPGSVFHNVIADTHTDGASRTPVPLQHFALEAKKLLHEPLGIRQRDQMPSTSYFHLRVEARQRNASLELEREEAILR
jgi:hypothetical protein